MPQALESVNIKAIFSGLAWFAGSVLTIGAMIAGGWALLGENKPATQGQIDDLEERIQEVLDDVMEYHADDMSRRDRIIEINRQIVREEGLRQKAENEEVIQGIDQKIMELRAELRELRDG